MHGRRSNRHGRSAADPAVRSDDLDHACLELVRLARQKLQHVPRRAADEEDVALSAFASFCRRAEGGHFPHLADREGLWQLLVVITVRKANRLRRTEGQQKRGGLARVISGNDAEFSLERLIDTDPTPTFALEVAEECERLLGLLDDPELQSIATRKMEGYTNNEIAAQLSCTPRTVERKLQLIRDIWEQELPS